MENAGERINEIDEAIAEAIRIREAMEAQIDDLNLIAAKLSVERTILLSNGGVGFHDRE